MSMLGGQRDDEDESLAAFQGRLERARELLTDPERTEFRVVLIPEAMAIAESERLVARLREAGVSVERLVVNRVLEDPTRAVRAVSRGGRATKNGSLKSARCFRDSRW